MDLDVIYKCIIDKKEKTSHRFMAGIVYVFYRFMAILDHWFPVAAPPV